MNETGLLPDLRLRYLMYVLCFICFGFCVFLFLYINGWIGVDQLWWTPLNYCGQHTLTLLLIYLFFLPVAVLLLIKKCNKPLLKGFSYFLLSLLVFALLIPSVNVYSIIYIELIPLMPQPMHYCKESYNNVLPYLGERMEWKTLVQTCGRPNFYEYDRNGGLSAVYTDSKLCIRVAVTKNGEAVIYHGTNIWKD